MPDTCLLCKEGKVYQIKSHLTPAGITENTYGEKDKEHIYTIDAQKKVIDEYFGRSHRQEENTEVKEATNSRKGIFCKKCETGLGTYESAVQDKLNELINGIGNGISINRTRFGAKYADINIHPNILITFFLSVIWRQCVEQILDNKDNPLSPEQFEELRNLVLKNISIPINEIAKSDIIDKPKITIFSSYKTKQAISFANPHMEDTNPLIFFIGPVVLLYWLSDIPTNEFDKVTLINKNLLDEELTLDKSKIGIVNEGIWQKIHYVFAKTLAGRYIKR
jgi:hypothetical protein